MSRVPRFFGSPLANSPQSDMCALFQGQAVSGCIFNAEFMFSMLHSALWAGRTLCQVNGTASRTTVSEV